MSAESEFNGIDLFIDKKGENMGADMSMVKRIKCGNANCYIVSDGEDLFT